MFGSGTAIKYGGVKASDYRDNHNYCRFNYKGSDSTIIYGCPLSPNLIWLRQPNFSLGAQGPTAICFLHQIAASTPLTHALSHSLLLEAGKKKKGNATTALGKALDEIIKLSREATVQRGSGSDQQISVKTHPTASHVSDQNRYSTPSRGKLRGGQAIWCWKTDKSQTDPVRGRGHGVGAAGCESKPGHSRSKQAGGVPPQRSANKRKRDLI